MINDARVNITSQWCGGNINITHTYTDTRISPSHIPEVQVTTPMHIIFSVGRNKQNLFSSLLKQFRNVIIEIVGFLESKMSTATDIFALYMGTYNDPLDALDKKHNYLEIENIRITPKEIIMANPFEGKVFKEKLVIRNCGSKPVLVRILNPSSSRIRMKAIKQGVFLCSGMTIRRTVKYTVQMVTLIKSCLIPIHINNETVINYFVKIISTPVTLIINPDYTVDFGILDASPTPAKRTLTITNSDVKPARYFIDLGPNDMELVVEPARGIILGEESVELDITTILNDPGTYSTEFWIVSDIPVCIHIRAIIQLANIEPLYTHYMRSFTFVQFPITYYGTSSTRNLVIYNHSTSHAFFCMMGEIELATFTLKEVKEKVRDYKYFSISPEEGRFLPNDIRVFRLVYTPVLENNAVKLDYNLVMMRIKRLDCKDLNPEDYTDEVFQEVKVRKPRLTDGDSKKSSRESFVFSQDPSLQEIISGISQTDTFVTKDFLANNEVRLMLYGQVEEVSVSVLPDALVMNKLNLHETYVRIFQLKNNCPSLPIYFRYHKVVFVETEPKFGFLKPLESIDVKVLITPKSCAPISTEIVFDLLYHNEPRAERELILLSKLKIPFTMDGHMSSALIHKDSLLAKNFEFKKPNFRPNSAIMDILMKSDIYIRLPDDRPTNLLPDRQQRKFRTIYAAIPRLQEGYNEFALTPTDLENLTKKNYYNMYIRMAQQKKSKKRPTKAILDECRKMVARKKIRNLDDNKYMTRECIPLTPIQLASLDIQPKTLTVENVAFNSTFKHTLYITNRNNSFLKIYLKARKGDFDFYNGNRFNIPAHSEKNISFIICIKATPLYNFELDVIINNCFVMETSVLVKASPKHLTLNVELLTFYENEPPSKYVELHNELNVAISFIWKVPTFFKVEPTYGEVVSGRFVACLITFEVGKAENMVYDLGIHTDNKYYNLKVLIEGTDYKVKMPLTLMFGEVSLNVPCYKSLPINNYSQQCVSFEICQESVPEDFKIQPKDGIIKPWGQVNLTICACISDMGDFNQRLEILVVHRKKIYCDMMGTVIFPDIHFRPEIVRFRKMAASSFDIACVTMINTTKATAMIQFDTERFPEFNYSEYTNTQYMTSKDVIYVYPMQEKEFSINFYPFNPLVTSFLLPIIVNKVGVGNKSKTNILMTRSNVKVHAQVLTYKLEVRTWKYHFTYFPYFNYKNTTSNTITIKNPAKSLLTFCIRLDEMEPPFSIKCKTENKCSRYDWSIVVDLDADEMVIFEVKYTPKNPGQHTIRLPVYIRDDFTNDMHNYFYLTGEYPAATYKYTEDAVHLGFIPLQFTISKKIIVDMAYHHPDCNCMAQANDLHFKVQIDGTKPKSTMNYKVVSFIFSSLKPHFLNAKLTLMCDCPGPNLELDVYGGCEADFFTCYACVQYFRFNMSGSFNAFFDNTEEMNNSNMSIHDADREDSMKHSYKNDLPYFQNGTEPFDMYMKQVVEIVEKYIMEQVFFGVRSFSIPDTICVPDVKITEKCGKRDGSVKLPLQLIYCHWLGPTIMQQFEIKYSEKKPLWMMLRKFYRDILSFLTGITCYVYHIKAEWLLPLDLYIEMMEAMGRKKQILHHKLFYLASKQAWLDVLLQSYKVLIKHRILTPLTSNNFGRSLYSLSIQSTKDTRETARSKRYGVNAGYGTIFSDNCCALINWVDRHFQEYKYKFASPQYRNRMTMEFNVRHIENFDEDLSDSLALVACVLHHCPFLIDYIEGIYAPASNRMEKFNNAYILLKILGLLKVSFSLFPMDIIEPNSIQMMMFLIYLYDFLQPLKTKDIIQFTADLSGSSEENIYIVNDSKHKIYYSIIFFNNDDNLFSVKEQSLSIDPGINSPTKLTITYNARFLRVQKTIMLLSGEIHGFQYTNSKIYYLEGKPDISKKVETKPIHSTVYKLSKARFEIQSPYPDSVDYDIFVVKEHSNDIGQVLESLIPYKSVLDTKTIVRVKLQSSVVTAEEGGLIPMFAETCSIINTSQVMLMLLRNKTVGDFMVPLNIRTRPMRISSIIRLVMPKSCQFPCTCNKKRGDVNNAKCPRNAKVMIPCRNEFLWKSVMEFFLFGRDPEENEFWDVYRNTQVGSHIVRRILYDYKRYLTSDMDYFMNKIFTYKVKVRESTAINVQKFKTIKEESSGETYTDILVHFNQLVKKFTLIMDSTDKKETRIYKVKVSFD